MKQKNSRTRSMYQIVINILKSFIAIWTSYVPLATAFESFEAKVAEIDLNLQKQMQILSGYTLNKRLKRTLMARLASITAKKVKAFAFASGDDILFGKMNISFSKIFRGKDIEGITFAELIYTAAFVMSPADKTLYNITAAEMTNLRKAIDDFITLPSPEQVRAIRKQITALLPQLFKDATGILKDNIDNLMSEFQLTDEEFFVQYFNARRTYESHRHTTVEGETIDMETGKDLSNVQIFIKSATDEFEEVSDVQGKFKRQIEPETNYTVKFVLPDYEPLEVANVNLNRGEHEKLKVQLKKINP